MAIPASLLIKGVNVIAVSACAAPLSERVNFHSDLNATRMPWPLTGVQSARLAAADRQGGLTSR